MMQQLRGVIPSSVYGGRPIGVFACEAKSEDFKEQVCVVADSLFSKS